jgi:hypothetical protein
VEYRFVAERGEKFATNLQRIFPNTALKMGNLRQPGKDEAVDPLI